MKQFDIPISFAVQSTNEGRAENHLADFLRQAVREYGVEYGIVDFEYLEFVAGESGSS